MTRIRILLCVLVMSVPTGAVFGQVESWVAIGPGVLSYTERVTDGINSGELEMNALGLDLTGVTFWNASQIGLYSQGYIFRPTSLTASSAGESANTDLSIYDFLMGVSLTVGPMYRIPLSSAVTTLAFGGGLRVNQLTGYFDQYISWSESVNYSFTSYTFGLSVDALIKADLADAFFVFGRVGFLYDFYGFGDATLNGMTFSYSGSANSTGLNASVGIGFNYYRHQTRFGRPVAN